MKNYKIRWTDTAGTTRVSSVAYDEPSAVDRAVTLQAAGHTDVDVFEVDPRTAEPAE